MQLVQVNRVDKSAYGRNTIGWYTCEAGVFTDAVFVRRQINAVDLVLGDVAVEPLNLRPHCFQRFQ